MDTKGPTLIATSLGLLFSGIVMVQSYNKSARETAASSAPVAEVTRNDVNWSRSTTTGGAVFISANDE